MGLGGSRNVPKDLEPRLKPFDRKGQARGVARWTVSPRRGQTCRQEGCDSDNVSVPILTTDCLYHCRN